MLSLNVHNEQTAGSEQPLEDRRIILLAAWCAAAGMVFQLLSTTDTTRNDEDDDNTPPRSITKRIRHPLTTIFEELGPYYEKRSYRMDEESFFELHLILYPFLKRQAIQPAQSSAPQQRKGAPNGILVPSTVCLAVALRYFAGASPYELAVCHGISIKEIYRSVWRVVDAIHRASSG